MSMSRQGEESWKASKRMVVKDDIAVCSKFVATLGKGREGECVQFLWARRGGRLLH